MRDARQTAPRSRRTGWPKLRTASTVELCVVEKFRKGNIFSVFNRECYSAHYFGQFSFHFIKPPEISSQCIMFVDPPRISHEFLVTEGRNFILSARSLVLCPLTPQIRRRSDLSAVREGGTANANFIQHVNARSPVPPRDANERTVPRLLGESELGLRRAG